MQNCHLVISHLNNNLPGTLRYFFESANNQHQHHSREAYNNKITVPRVKTTRHDLQSMKYKAAKDWDEIQKESKTTTSVMNAYQKIIFQTNLSSTSLTMTTR